MGKQFVPHFSLQLKTIILKMNNYLSIEKKMYIQNISYIQTLSEIEPDSGSYMTNVPMNTYPNGQKRMMLLYSPEACFYSHF